MLRRALPALAICLFVPAAGVAADSLPLTTDSGPQPGVNGLSFGADGMTVDTEGRTYVTTRQGLQVLDQLGRCHFIFLKPQNAWLSNAVFGGPKLDTLYVTCGDKVYRRKIKARGLLPAKAAVEPPRPHL